MCRHNLRTRKGENLILGLSHTAARLREDEAALPLLPPSSSSQDPSPLPPASANSGIANYRLF